MRMVVLCVESEVVGGEGERRKYKGKCQTEVGRYEYRCITPLFHSMSIPPRLYLSMKFRIKKEGGLPDDTSGPPIELEA